MVTSSPPLRNGLQRPTVYIIRPANTSATALVRLWCTAAPRRRGPPHNANAAPSTEPPRARALRLHAKIASDLEALVFIEYPRHTELLICGRAPYVYKPGKIQISLIKLRARVWSLTDAIKIFYLKLEPKIFFRQVSRTPKCDQRKFSIFGVFSSVGFFGSHFGV